MDEPTERISKSKGWLMIGVAILFDLIGFVPFLNIATAIANLMLFPIWFHLLGASYIKNRRMLGWTVVTSAIGLIPFVSSVLPELTLGVVRNVRFIQKEDKQKAQQTKNFVLHR